METMTERRQGQHKAVHKLSQVYANLLLAEKEVKGLEGTEERKHRALCFIREASEIVRRVVDNDLGMRLIEKETV